MLPKERKMYNTAKVSELLEISKRTLFDLEKRGIIPAVPRDWRGWRIYDDSHLEAVRNYQTSKARGITGKKSGKG